MVYIYFFVFLIVNLWLPEMLPGYRVETLTGGGVLLICPEPFNALTTLSVVGDNAKRE